MRLQADFNVLGDMCDITCKRLGLYDYNFRHMSYYVKKLSSL